MLIHGYKPQGRDVTVWIKQLQSLPCGFSSRDVDVDPQAWGVGQGEMGLSQHQPMGTDAIDSCIAVAVRDPLTQLTGLAHVDAATAAGSLQGMLDKMPRRDIASAPLQVRLVGAKRATVKDDRTFAALIGQNNLRKIMTFLSDKPVDIISAALFDPSQPASLIIEPSTFAMTDAVPGMHATVMRLATAKAMFAQKPTPLHPAFDLTSSDTRNPPLFQEEEKEKLRERFADGGKAYIRHWFEQNRRHYGQQQVTDLVESVASVIEAAQAASEQVISRLQGVIRTLEKQGALISEADRRKATVMLRAASLHIGPGAEEANMPLIRLIEERLFTLHPDGSYTLHADRLERFRFAQNPPDVARQGLSFSAGALDKNKTGAAAAR